MNIGAQIARLRKEKGWSQEELAGKIGTSAPIVGRYERDEMTPSIEAAQKIAELLDTTVAWLLGEVAGGQVLKDTAMLRRLNEIAGREAKTRKAYAS